MNIKSSNGVGDYFLVSCGNEDDSLLRIWDLRKMNLYTEITTPQKSSFYYLNLLVFEEEKNELSEDKSQFWETSGLIIIAASMKRIYLYGIDLREKQVSAETKIDISPDIGSYLSIMQIFISSHLNGEGENGIHEDKLCLLISTVDGFIHSYIISLRTTFESNKILADISQILPSERNLISGIASPNIDLS